MTLFKVVLPESWFCLAQGGFDGAFDEAYYFGFIQGGTLTALGLGESILGTSTLGEGGWLTVFVLFLAHGGGLLLVVSVELFFAQGG